MSHPWFAVIVAAVLAAPLSGSEVPPPRFEDHPAVETFDGTPAPLDIVQAKAWKKQRNVLRKALAAGPNFGGAFTIATFSCGHLCQQIVVMDARTGTAVGDLRARTGSNFRRDSTMLIVNPAETISPKDEKTTTLYYTWRDGAFAQVGGD